MKTNFQVKNLIMFLVAIFVGVLLGLTLIYFFNLKKNYYAVLLNNGQIYFGRLSTFPKLKLDDAVFIQVDNQGQISFPSFKNALWKPKGTIYLNRDAIVFIAPIAQDSFLVNLINGQSQQSQQQLQQPQLQPQSQSQPQSQPQPLQLQPPSGGNQNQLAPENNQVQE